MQQDSVAELDKYLPPNIAVEVLEILKRKNAVLTITKKRTTKLGDYRRPTPQHNYHRISVNGSLNKYAFLITLYHEIAHLEVYERYKSRVLPHGKEWKSIFSKMLEKLLSKKIFPNDITIELRRYAENPKASSASDVRLMMALKNHDSNDALFLNQIGQNCVFKLGKKTFVKGEKRRTRFLCKELNSKRFYVISGLAEIQLISEPLDL